jgi:hypothetical protein
MRLCIIPRIDLRAKARKVGDVIGRSGRTERQDRPAGNRSVQHRRRNQGHRIANGKIVEHRAVRDDLWFMMQLGLVGLASPQYAPVFEAWKGFMR